MITDSRHSILWTQSPDGLFAVDEHGIICDVNPVGASMFKYAPEELVGQPVEVLIPNRFEKHPELRQAYISQPSKRLMKGRVMFALCKDGGELEVDIELIHSAEVSTLSAAANTLVRIRDATERRQYLKDQSKIEHEAAGRARSRFLANISHEFRTPLNAILGLHQLILQKRDLEPSISRNIDLAMQSGMQLLDLLNNILEIARIESEELVLEERRFVLETLRQSIENMYHSEADRKGIEYSVRMTGGLPDMVVGDEQKIRQILIHLIGNAFKFTNKGEIRVTFSKDKADELLIEVADTGAGIAVDRLVTLFEPFQQVARENSAGEGSGLGLAICKNYISAMNGTIDVDSVQDKGACFRLSLPILKQSRLLEAPLPPVDPAVLDDSKVRVLVVDDSDSNRVVLGQLLTGAGYDFYEACDGVEAVEMAAQCLPQVILMDLQMPRMDGYEATRRIKAMMETVIVAVSANVFDADIKKAEEAGVSGFIKKPFRLGMILDEIEKQMSTDTVVAKAESEPSISLESLTAVEIAELHQALLRADPYDFKNLVYGYDRLDEQTTSQLVNMLESFQYDKLLDVLKLD